MITIPGFARDFPPTLVLTIAQIIDVEIVLEVGYGSDLGYLPDEYKSKNICFQSRSKIFKTADLVISLTAPPDLDIAQMKKQSTLVSMLHFSTHPERNRLMKGIGVNGISLDILFDCEGNRLVQDLKNTAWNGIEVGFSVLINKLGKKWWYSADREDITVILLGFGGVGKSAIEAIIRFGSKDRFADLSDKKGNLLVNIFPLISQHNVENLIQRLIDPKSLLKGGQPHLLVDASRRTNYAKSLFSKNILSLLPQESVIVDLTADCYEGKTIIKGIPGLPTGSEKQWIFEPDDPAWIDDKQIPVEFQLPKSHRRTVVSNYAWPSYGSKRNRIKNMEKYSNQIYPVIKSIIETNFQHAKKEVELWEISSAISKASLDKFMH